MRNAFTKFILLKDSILIHYNSIRSHMHRYIKYAQVITELSWHRINSNILHYFQLIPINNQLLIFAYTLITSSI